MTRTHVIVLTLAGLIGALVVLVWPSDHAASPGPAQTPSATPRSHSAGLATLAPALPTPSPVQARRMALRPSRRPSPASRSRRITGGLPAILIRIRGCESGNGPTSPGDYSNVNSLSGASGAFQFLDSTWHYVTHLPGKSRDYSRATQDWGALKLYRSEGTTPWNSSRGCWA